MHRRVIGLVGEAEILGEYDGSSLRQCGSILFSPRVSGLRDSIGGGMFSGGW
jgi:hypothetical protein